MPALTSHDVGAAQLVRTRFREGYDIAEVDALLGRVASSLDDLAAGRVGPRTLTGDHVLHAKLTAARFRPGYDQDEVDDFLDRAVLALRAGHADVGAVGPDSTAGAAPGN